MAITRRPHRRVGPRLYQYTDVQGGFFVRVEGYNGAEIGPHISTHKVDLPPRSSLAEAMLLRDRIYADLEAGRYARVDPESSRAWTLGDATDRFIEMKARTWRPGSLTSNLSRSRQWSELRDLPVAALRRTHVERLVQRVERDTGAVHARNVLLALRAVLRFAIAWGQLERSVAEAVALSAAPANPVRVLPDIETIHRFLSALERIDEAAPTRTGVGLMARLQYYAAMRPGEAAAMQWNWIDRRDLTVKLPAEVVKTRRGREFPIAPRLIDLLEEHRRWLLEFGSPAQQLEAGRVRLCFPQPAHASVMRVSSYGGDRWREACRDVGLPAGREGWSPHKLRYAGISRMLSAGMDRRVVMAMVGHSSEVISWHYSKPFAQEIEEARPTLDRLAHEARLAGESLNTRNAEGYIQGTDPSEEKDDE